ncbi:MAG: hypothetical protein A3K06_03930 [Candidatus Doudnabacteria bacterium RIFCSPHIGHO2_01_52_17]|uniref:Uncharacterized protein n=1 Tax=Candidatus Doudnabacteria bacterium RIFCSPHIGHO2_01_52_17 TaxID=1817820 RepID=A0A1F5NFF4_9BACT|nr:MAG: hypothetical protein A3K06_03930 [Candidatus Doudnabacteria bacterium RIFCSPHIGHO2_01_52_17]
MRKFSLLQILGVLVGLLVFVFLVDAVFSSSIRKRKMEVLSQLPSASPEVKSCIAEEENTRHNYYPRILVYFYPREENIGKANALLHELGFPNTLGAVSGKTDEIRLEVVRDEKNILEEFFQGVNSVDYQNFLKGHLGLIKPELFHELTDRIRKADSAVAKRIEADNADIGSGATPRQSYKSGTSFMQEYIIDLASHISREEVDNRFGQYDLIRIDYYQTFYLDPIDFSVFIDVKKGTEIAWMCYFKVEHSDLVQSADVDIPVGPI